MFSSAVENSFLRQKNSGSSQKWERATKWRPIYLFRRAGPLLRGMGSSSRASFTFQVSAATRRLNSRSVLRDRIR